MDHRIIPIGTPVRSLEKGSSQPTQCVHAAESVLKASSYSVVSFARAFCGPFRADAPPRPLAKVMEAMLDYDGSKVEVAFRSRPTPWPTDRREARAFIEEISADSWKQLSRSVAVGRWTRVASLSREAPHGTQWFHVWESHARNRYPDYLYRFAIVKSRNPSFVIVTCTLEARARGVFAEYALLSGECFGSRVFGFDDTVTVADVEKDCLEATVRENVRESKFQPMVLMFAGFSVPLRGSVVLWGPCSPAAVEEVTGDEVAARQELIDKWMAHLKALTFDQLDRLILDAHVRNLLLGLAPPMTQSQYMKKHCRRDR